MIQRQLEARVVSERYIFQCDLCNEIPDKGDMFYTFYSTVLNSTVLKTIMCKDCTKTITTQLLRID